MAKTATSKLVLKLTGTMSDNADLENAAASLSYEKTHSLTNGTGAGEANQIFSDTRTLALSASEELDLAGGLTDALGDTVTLTEVKTLVIRASESNGANIVVGGSATNSMSSIFGDPTDKIVLKPGALIALSAGTVGAGYAVTAGTGDLLKIENTDGAASASYDIIVVGTV